MISGPGEMEAIWVSIHMRLSYFDSKDRKIFSSQQCGPVFLTPHLCGLTGQRNISF